MSDKQEEMLIKLAKYFGIDPDEEYRNEAISSALLKRIDAILNKKTRGRAKGGMIKKKGYARGGMMKKKGVAKGGAMRAKKK